MSLHSANELLALVKADADLNKRLAEAKSEQEIQQIIKAAGDFDFTHSEWLQALDAQSGRELNDADLDSVSEGVATDDGDLNS